MEEQKKKMPVIAKILIIVVAIILVLAILFVVSVGALVGFLAIASVVTFVILIKTGVIDKRVLYATYYKMFIYEVVEIGEFPQTIKAPDVTITDKINQKGYYLGSDGEWYARVVSDQPYFYHGYTFSNGESVEHQKEYYFKVEPIKWRVLSKDDGTVLLLSESILMPYIYDKDTNNYAQSDIRMYLNTDFSGVAFSEEEKARIYASTTDNSLDSTGCGENAYICEDTQDAVFLPSVKEVTDAKSGFAYEIDTARSLKVTDYAIAMGAYMDTTDRTGYWRLRSPSPDTDQNVYFVDDAGIIFDYAGIDGNIVKNSTYGIAPAMRYKR